MASKQYKSQRRLQSSSARLRPKRSRLKKIVKNRWFWFTMLFCVAVGGAVYGILFTSFFQIKHIEIQGNETLSVEKLSQAASGHIPRQFAFFKINHFLLVDTAGVVAELRAAFPEIELVAVRKKFPDRIQILVRERQGIAIWCQNRTLRVALEDSEEETERSIRQCFALDKQGVIFGEKEPAREVIVSVEGAEAGLGDTVVDPLALENMLRFQQGVDALSLFEQIGLRVLSLHIVSKERVNARISEGWEMYFNPEERVDWQFQKGKLVLEQEIPFEKRPFLEYIDLRFGDQAYIKYK